MTLKEGQKKDSAQVSRYNAATFLGGITSFNP